MIEIALADRTTIRIGCDVDVVALDRVLDVLVG
jgi:hypothetical protein